MDGRTLSLFHSCAPASLPPSHDGSADLAFLDPNKTTALPRTARQEDDGREEGGGGQTDGDFFPRAR